MLPFRTYDIPGALVSGFLILAGCEAGYDGSWLIDQDWNPERISVYGSMSLCIGLVVAALSHNLLELKFVGGWLKTPEEILLGGASTADRNWKRALFPGYYAPIAHEMRGRILTAADGSGEDGPGRMRRSADSRAVARDRAPANRFSMSLQLCAICRTLCLGLFVVSLILASGILWHSAVSGWGQAEWRKLGYCTLSLFEAVGMLYRYLKYCRLYAIERLIGRSGLPA